MNKSIKTEFGLGREMLTVQGQHGNWNYSRYMHGMYNGMEYMLSLMEDRDPVYRNVPAKFIDNKNLPVDFCLRLKENNPVEFKCEYQCEFVGDRGKDDGN